MRKRARDALWTIGDWLYAHRLNWLGQQVSELGWLLRDSRGSGRSFLADFVEVDEPWSEQ